MVIQFGRDICGQLALAERREWLVTNGIGGYACGTIAGTLTRHYHGLLNAALKPPLDRTLLLAKVDETVVYGGQTYRLYCDRWADGCVTPHGYLHLERFALEGTIPTWYYALRDGLLTKRVWMEQGSNTTYIRYDLKQASAPVHLSLKALVNHRKHHHSTSGRDWMMHIEPIESRNLSLGEGGAVPVQAGIQVTAGAETTPFYVISDRGTCTPQHEWYWGYDLAVERYRGIDPHDDHLHGGTFEIKLSEGEQVTLVATTEWPDRVPIAGAIARQQRHEQHLRDRWQASHRATSSAPAWLEQLVLAADQFVVARSTAREVSGKTVIAGYPWFGDWGRDTMIALPGLAIATGRPELARPMLRTFAHYVDQGMLPNVFPEAGDRPAYNTVDATLWYFEAIRQYYAVSHDAPLLKALFPVLADIIHWHQRGTRYSIHLDEDGLLYAGDGQWQLTWMDAKAGDWVVTPRTGKAVEINALWYNALLIMAQFADQLGVSTAPYRELAAQTRQGFQRFWSDSLGYCQDVLDTPMGADAALRPNQIFAVALPTLDAAGPALLTPPQQRAVVETVAQHLLTSYGLRSLSPAHPDYCGHYGGDRLERDGCYHQGTVWSWLIGPFIQAHLRVYQNPALARTLLDPFADHLRDGCIGTLSEIFDGDAPFTPRGAFAQAWSVAEVLRSWKAIAHVATRQSPP